MDSSAELQRSIQWLNEWEIDDGCRKLFLRLAVEDQIAIRKLGGLKSKGVANAILMGRIRNHHGYVPEQTEASSSQRAAPTPLPTGDIGKGRGDIGKGSTRADTASITESYEPKLKKWKGEGKSGSLGGALEKDTGYNRTTPAAGSSGPEDLTYPSEGVRKYTPEEIENMLNGGYYSKPEEPFCKDINTLRKGSHVIWQGICHGKSGGESTREDFFHGIFHSWESSNRAVVS